MTFGPRLALLLLPLLASCNDSRAAPVSVEPPAPDPAYDRYRRPERIIAALDLRPGQSVADVGAGRGYLTIPIAAALGPAGRVVATDIDPAAIESLRLGARRAGATNIAAREVSANNPGLEANAYDRVLLAEVDQYLANRGDYFRQLIPALHPGGRIILTNRLPYRDAVVAAAASAGLCKVSEANELPGHFLYSFEARTPCD